MDTGGGGQLFSIDPLEGQDVRGDDVFTSMAAGSDVIVLGTSRGCLVRHDYTLEDAHGKSPPPPFAPSPSVRHGETSSHLANFPPPANLDLEGVCDNAIPRRNSEWADMSLKLTASSIFSRN
jgi:hypothetical protein